MNFYPVENKRKLAKFVGTKANVTNSVVITRFCFRFYKRHTRPPESQKDLIPFEQAERSSFQIVEVILATILGHNYLQILSSEGLRHCGIQPNVV